MKFVESCVADSLPIWDACLETEFLKKMADGSLSEDCFKGYIVDDSLYLREYAKVFAWGILGGIWDVFTLSPLALVDVIIPIIAILNYLLFFWSDLQGFFSSRVRRAKYQHARQTVNFKQATRQAQQHKGYIHKCAVCGKTDTDYPDEEFRYCSKCNGYYCYCSEHIHNHVHIQ